MMGRLKSDQGQLYTSFILATRELDPFRKWRRPLPQRMRAGSLICLLRRLRVCESLL